MPSAGKWLLVSMTLWKRTIVCIGQASVHIRIQYCRFRKSVGDPVQEIDTDRMVLSEYVF
uniref:Predicted protein n=1 Tax=Hordeum vulgare subsp. vulgare TaxID=112509 RepID=F2EI75_HORVV|nr:predicted protein [Hordeum vulgare subsp. vulgare]